MKKRRTQPGLCVLRTYSLLLLASTACSRAVRYGVEATERAATETATKPVGIDAATRTELEAAAGSTLVGSTFEAPDWFLALKQVGAALVRQAAEQTLPEAYRLHHAAFVGNEAQLEAYIESHPKWIDKSTSGNVTPLHLAVFQGNVECVRLLLDAGASVRSVLDASSVRAVHMAASSGLLPVLNLLLEAQRTTVADVDATGKTALHWAAAKGHTLCVQELLQAGSAPNREDAWGHTPLCLAFAGNHTDAAAPLVEAGSHIECVTCMHSDSDRLLRWALAHKAHTCVAAVVRKATVPVDLYRKDAAGETLLDCALRSAHLPSIRILLWKEIEANWVNHRGQDGVPLLHRVVAGNHPTLLTQLLAEKNLDIHAQDAARTTALHLAACCGHTAAVEALIQVDGIDPNAQDAWGCTPLHRAALLGHLALVEVLVQIPGIDLNAQDAWGYTPLHRAARGGHAEVVEILAKIPEIDLNAQDAWGYTPLHRAACYGHTAAVETLIRVPGIDLNARDRRGYTPRHLAACCGHTAAVEALIKVNGIKRNAQSQSKKRPWSPSGSSGLPTTKVRRRGYRTR